MRYGDRVTVYRGTSRWANRLAQGAWGLFDGFWLGILDNDALAQVDAAYYEAASMYHQEEYNRRGLWRWERVAIERHFPSRGRIAVTGAGGGREVLALLALGFDAQGYEPHVGLAELGARLTQQDGYGPRVSACARDAWPDVPGYVDGVITGWGSFMHIAGRRRRVEYLAGARSALPVGGPILLSFFPRGRATLRHRVTARFGSGLRRARREAPLDVGDCLLPNFTHYFSRSQLASELLDAGFDLVEFDTEDYGWAVARAKACSSGREGEARVGGT